MCLNWRRIAMALNYSRAKRRDAFTIDLYRKTMKGRPGRFGRRCVAARAADFLPGGRSITRPTALDAPSALSSHEASRREKREIDNGHRVASHYPVTTDDHQWAAPLPIGRASPELSAAPSLFPLRPPGEAHLHSLPVSRSASHDQGLDRKDICTFAFLFNSLRLLILLHTQAIFVGC